MAAKKYDVIYADPPWSYQDNNCQGAAAKQYPTLANEDIYKLPIAELAADNCVLFLWATYPKLPEALETIKAWGFTYKSIAFQWVKVYPKAIDKFFLGLGRWTRGNTEACLLAVKGHPKRKSGGGASVSYSPYKKTLSKAK